MNTIQLEQKNSLIILTLCREEALNAINQEMLDDLDEVLTEIEKNSDLRCMIITGSGSKSFAAGADVREMERLTHEQAHHYAAKACHIIDRISFLPIPVIAAINGYALGGGLELALACDLRFASESAILGCPEVSLGIMPGWGGTRRLPKLIGYSNAAYIIFSGVKMDAKEALRLGILNAYTQSENLFNLAFDTAERICASSPLGIASAKKSLQHYASLENSCSFENHLFAELFESQDQKNGMHGFIFREKVTFEGK